MYEVRTQRENGNPDYSTMTFGDANALRRWVLENPQPALGYYRTFWSDKKLVPGAEVEALVGGL